MRTDYTIRSVPEKGVGLYYTHFENPVPCRAVSYANYDPKNNAFAPSVAKVRLTVARIAPSAEFGSREGDSAVIFFNKGDLTFPPKTAPAAIRLQVTCAIERVV